MVVRDGHVLLVLRAAGANKGLWSLPGGHLEPGETAEAAARREVFEETGLVVRTVGVLATVDVQSGANVWLITVFHAVAVSGHLAANGDAAKARFVTPEDMARLPLTKGTGDLILAHFPRSDANAPPQ